MNEFQCCPKCKDKNGALPLGFIEHKTQEGIFAEECECHKKWVLESTLEAKFIHNGFDASLFNYSIRNYVGNESRAEKDRLINYVAKFDDPKVKKCIVYMYGKNGTQKTVLGNWIGKSLLSKGYSVRYLLMNNLVGMLQDAGFKDGVQEKLDKLDGTDLLIIDEAFDKEKMRLYKSGFQISFIDTWLRNRIQTLNKGVVFISNVKPEDIEKQGLSHSIQDFVERECKKCNSFLEFKDNYILESHTEYDSSVGLF